MSSLNTYIDATLLKPEARPEDYKKLCQDAIFHQFAAVCVPPFMVVECREMLRDSAVKLATVVGFPAGYQTLDIKIAELIGLIEMGAEEIDYVIHRGYLAQRDFAKIEEETEKWIDICKQENIVSKWIIECSSLNSGDIDILIDLANAIKPDFVKTSTGVYGKANKEQVAYLRKNLSLEIKIKAAGGISDRATALGFIQAGALRLGVSDYSSVVGSLS